MVKKAISICTSIILYLSFHMSIVSAKNPNQMSIEEKIGQTMCLDFRFWSNESLKSQNINLESMPTSIIKIVISKKYINKVILFFKKNMNQEKTEKLVSDLQTAINQNNEFISLSKIFDENAINAKQAKKIIWGFEQIISLNSFLPVTEINDDIKEIIAKYHIGSVILFSQNFKNKKQTKKLINDLQLAAKESGNPPLIIGVDQEGGKIERFAFDRKKLKNNSEIKTAEEAFKKGKIIGKELKDLGINCNFAPVVDINSNPKNPVINIRSFGNNPDVVSEFGTKFMQGLHLENIISTAKHFPGHGDTSVDSHFKLPRVKKSLKELTDLELKPFQAMINAGVDMIMTTHIEFPQIENKTIISKKDGKEFFLPATVSRTILTDLLRKKMSFEGVIITDAMNMKAISKYIDAEEMIKMAIEAGADMICMPVSLRSKSDIIKLNKVYETLKNAVKSKKNSEEQLNESVDRILKLKSKYCSYDF